MKETHTVESKFATEPTALSFERKLKEVLRQLRRKETLESSPKPTQNQLSLLINRNGTTYWAKIETDYGSQETGFTINVMVEGRNDFDTEDTKSILQNIDSSITDLFTADRMK